MRAPRPILTGHLFIPLHDELIALLRGLDSEEWSKPTAAGDWTVRDVAAHLLDTAIRRLSIQRDGHLPPGPFQPNEMNREWVVAARRLSPRVMIELMERYGRENAEYLASLDPFSTAQWGVTWAGEDESPVWFDVARELTERWHHQQQIRDATGRPALYEGYLRPVIATFVRALPHTYREVEAPEGTAAVVRIDEDAWTLVREGGRWGLYEGAADSPATTVELSGDTAWRLFTKQKVDPRAKIEGDPHWAEPLFKTVAVIG